MAFPEHHLQAAIKFWCKRYVLTPHVFLAFDRSRAMSATQHILEAQRGIRAGTPDTVLAYSAGCVWVELKVGRNVTSEAQNALHTEMLGVGHEVAVIYSVGAYCQLLIERGLDIHRLGMAEAEALDRKLALKKKSAPKKAGGADRHGGEVKTKTLAVLARARKSGVFG